MNPIKRVGQAAVAMLPDAAERLITDLARSARFETRARAFRSEYGLRPAGRRLTVLAYPQPVTRQPHVLVAKLCAALGYHVVSVPTRPYDVALRFHDATFSDPSLLDPLPPDLPVINRGATDISKTRVAREYERAFGGQSLVDPRTHEGEIVEKPDVNAADGRGLVVAPLEPRDGFVYQRLIDSRTGDGHYIEYRLPVHDGRFPLVYRKVIDEGTRFEKKATRVTIEDPADHFSADELDRIGRLAHAMGVEFGELDVLRDNGDGLPYVIDVNDTPWGELKWVSPGERARAYSALAASFQRMCEARLRPPGGRVLAGRSHGL